MPMKSIIQKNFQDLCDCTDPNDTLINGLVMSGIIPPGIKERLRAEKNKETINFDLYTFLNNSRTDKDLDKVMEILEKSANSAAYEIFRTGQVHKMPVGVNNVVSTILTTGGLEIVGEMYRIAFTLGVHGHDVGPWFIAYHNATLDSHDLFTKMLGSWVVQNGEEATIGRLTNILKSMEFSAVAEAISKLGNSKTLITLSETQQAPASTSNNVPNSNTKTFSHDVKQKRRLSRALKWKQYRVEELLGVGCFGCVFKIKKDPAAIPSAVKIVVLAPDSDADCNLPSDAVTDEVIKANRELHAMRTLPNHQNVVQLLNWDILYPTSINVLEHYGHELGLLQMQQSSTSMQIQRGLGDYSNFTKLSSNFNTVFIEMELCGSTLRKWLDSLDTLRQMQNRSEEFAHLQFDIAQCIISGLKHLHDNHMMHRDLKPDNIYFSYDNTTDKFALPVKIGDLGLTRQLSEQAKFDLTKTEPRGASLYRAREVNSGSYGKPADLFSLGLVLWEVFDVIQEKDIRRKFEDLTIDNRHKSLIKQNQWVPNLVDTIFNLTYRDQKQRTQSIDNVKLEFKSH